MTPTDPTPKDEAQDAVDDDARNGFLVRKVVAGEGLLVGPDIMISVRKVNDDKAQVSVSAPKNVTIRRISFNQPRKDPP